MSNSYWDLSKKYVVDTYDPLQIIVERAEGCYYIDTEGKRYLNFTAAYSAQNWGILNERFIEVMAKQAYKLPLTSRAIENTVLPIFAKEACELFGYDKLIPMNSGAEAVETAIKVARRWGSGVKGVPENSGEIIVFNNNFAGRTITIISFSEEGSETEMKKGFGPFTPGFKLCELNNLDMFKQLVTNNTIAVLLEPIQGEGGINVIDSSFYQALYDLSKEHRFLLIADEIQCGLFRAGKLVCSDWFRVKPDILILGKSLGGGLLPVSVVLGSENVFSQMRVGSHGSTFGGSPLAARVGLEVVRYLKENRNQLEAEVIRKGEKILRFLKDLKSNRIADLRGLGLMIGMELKCDVKDFIIKCAYEGLIVGKARNNTIRLTPPLIISDEDIEFALSVLENVLSSEF